MTSATLPSRPRTLIAAVLLVACSGGGGTRNPSSGGSSGGNTGSGAAGSGGTVVTGGGGGGGAAPTNPLCPPTGPIVPGATPLPDGVEVITDFSGVYRVVVGGGFAYWTTETAIHRVPVTGGAAMVVLDRATARNRLGTLAVDGATLYFAESGIYSPFGVARMPADGSAAPTTLASGNSLGRIVLAGGYVYYFDAGLGELHRVPVGGGTPTTLVRDVDPSDLLAVANGYLYFVNPRSNSFDVHLFRVRVDAVAPSPDAGVDPDAGTGPRGAEIVAVTDNYSTDGVVADGTNIYWDEANRVMKLPLTGGTPVALDEQPEHAGTFNLPETTYIGSVAAAGGMVYWNIGLACGDIMRAAPDGTQKTAVVHGALAVTGLTVDATHLYFVAYGRQLLRAPR